MNAQPRLKLLVVGNGMVGQRLLDTLVRDAAGRFAMTVLGEEPRLAYDRVHLSSFFSGKSAADLAMVDAGFFREHGITVYLGDAAVSLDRERRCVTTASGRALSYDKLVLATGSYPFVPPIPGKERPQCLVYRTIEDLEAIRAAAALSRVGVVIGGGLLGLEAAKALQDLGLETHVVEFAPRLMAVQLDERRRRHAARENRTARGARAHRQSHRRDHTGQRLIGTHCNLPTAASCRPISSCSPPASGPATNSRV